MTSMEDPPSETKVLALDVSTKTGWAFFVGGKLISQGLIRLGGSELKKVSEYGPYPQSYLNATDALANAVYDRVKSLAPDVVVIEETNGSRARYTQKILEFLHCQILRLLDRIETCCIKVYYVNSSEWRKVLGMALTKEQKKANAKLAKATRAAAGGKVDKAALGIKGKITKKHLSVAYANGAYGLKLKVKDNDIADAICLGTAYVKGAKVCDGT